ncbi:MAG: phosphatidate cytidylyltransferase, partial [Prochlorothrix sp.]|nr:phosphatidate cytidylyltransferase [Prochlorothrix sp.]
MPWTRIISTIVAIFIALGMVVLGGWYFTLFFGILVYFGLMEYFQMARAKKIAPAAKTTLVASQLILIICTIAPPLADAIVPLAGTIICTYLLLQPKAASIA